MRNQKQRLQCLALKEHNVRLRTRNNLLVLVKHLDKQDDSSSLETTGYFVFLVENYEVC